MHTDGKRIETSKHPAVVRVRTEERAQDVLALCQDRGIQAIVGIEPDKPEDISDVEKLLASPFRLREVPQGRVTIAQHGFSTGTHFRTSGLIGAEPVLGKLATGARVPSGTADTHLAREILFEGNASGFLHEI